MNSLVMMCTVILVVLLSAVSVVGCQQTKTYSGHGVSFDYPMDWVEVEASAPGALWTVAFEKERGSSLGGGHPGVGVAAYPMEGMTLRGFNQTLIWTATNLNYTTPIIDETINGWDAIKYSWAEESGVARRKGDTMYITKDYEVVYYVDCSAYNLDYVSSEDDFNMVLNSFKIE